MHESGRGSPCPLLGLETGANNETARLSDHFTGARELAQEFGNFMVISIVDFVVPHLMGHVRGPDPRIRGSGAGMFDEDKALTI